MTEHLPPSESEPKPVADDARKFRPRQLEALFEPPFADAKSYRMTTYWTSTGDDTESKLVLKEQADGTKEYLSIVKITHPDGQRDSTKEPISEETFQDRLWKHDLDTLPVSIKRRHEFEFAQGDYVYEGKYDEFEGSGLSLLEIDAASKDPVARTKFDPDEFAAAIGYSDGFVEVSDDPSYTGYLIVDKAKLF